MLGSKQRAALASSAQKLPSLASLGRSGLTEAFAARVSTLLGHHELVKLRFQDFKERKSELAAELAQRTNSELVSMIGNVAVFYRRAEDPAKRKYEAAE
jgi:RNA-binding protein